MGPPHMGPAKTRRPTSFRKSCSFLACFAGTGTLDVRWVPYRLLACVMHHGEHLWTGHYRTLVSAGSDCWILDDARAAERADEDQLEEASTSMYLLLIVLSHSHQVAIHSSQQSPAVDHGHSSDVPAATEAKRLASGTRPSSFASTVPNPRCPAGNAPAEHGHADEAVNGHPTPASASHQLRPDAANDYSAQNNSSCTAGDAGRLMNQSRTTLKPPQKPAGLDQLG